MKRPAHLDFIRSLPCISCGDNICTEAAHIRYTDSSVAKMNAGIGAKPADYFTVPLCSECHLIQGKNEKEFWAVMGIDPVKKALALWAYSGNRELAIRLVREK